MSCIQTTHLLGADLSFELVTHKFFRGEQSKAPHRTYTLVASSPDDLTSWLDALQQHPNVTMNDRDVEEEDSSKSNTDIKNNTNNDAAAQQLQLQHDGFAKETIGDTSFSSGWMIKLGAIRNTFRKHYLIISLSLPSVVNSIYTYVLESLPTIGYF